MANTSDLRQFSRREWVDAMLRFRHSPELGAAFEPLMDLWCDIAHCKFEDARDFDATWAEEDFELDLHVGQVRFRDLDWLRETFGASELAALALRLGPIVHADRAWALVESEAHAVVVDHDRTLVLDLKYGERLSAGASLVLAGQRGDHAASDEAMRFLAARVAEERARLARFGRGPGDVAGPLATVVH